MKKAIIFVIPLVIGLMGMVPQAHAAVYTIETIDSGVVFDAAIGGRVLFEQQVDPGQSYSTFVQLSSNSPIEQGYNTDGRPAPFDADQSASLTRAITVGDVGERVDEDGILYKEFYLQIDQLSESPEIILDKLKVYISSDPNLNSTNLDTLGTLLWDMGDNAVKISAALEAASGDPDLVFDLPAETGIANEANGSQTSVQNLFENISNSSFLYLYSELGNGTAFGVDGPGNNGGPEQWQILGSPTQPGVPEPVSMALLGLGFGVIGLSKWGKKK